MILCHANLENIMPYKHSKNEVGCYFCIMSIKTPLFFREYGQGEPLVILHGFLGLSDNWVSHARHLSDTYRVIIPDMRNHGRSFHSKIMNYEAIQDDILFLFDHLNIDKAILLGHSMGGKAAMLFADRHPEKVQKLIIADIGPGEKKSDNSHQKILEALDNISLESFTNRSDITLALSMKIDQTRIIQFLLKSILKDKNGLFLWKFNLEVLKNCLPQITKRLIMQGDYHGPVLLIRGELSDYVTESDLNAMNSLYPQLIERSITGATHWLHADSPAVFLKYLREFLKFC